ncbi:MAG: rhomboid family intramembrane serine protease GlpG [Algicola sp.]|nr:rhomboid family intramembrane serine protease GlpG [Algicola sp.]
MHLIATINNPRAAQAFVDYMQLKSIEVKLKPIESNSLEPGSEMSIELWVDEACYQQSVSEWMHFSQNPQDKKYLDASWQRNSADNPLTYRSGGKSLTKSWFSQGGWVTHGMVALCVIVFVLSFFFNIFIMLVFPAQGIFGSVEVWRWFTPALYHFGLLHIVFNLLWWRMLAGLLEKHFSPSLLILFTLFAAVISNFAQFVVSGHNQFGGLSGVVYALMGFCWLYGRLKPEQSVKLADPLFVFGLIWLVMGYTKVLLWSNIANTAHLSGLLAGLAFAVVIARKPA